MFVYIFIIKINIYQYIYIYTSSLFILIKNYKYIFTHLKIVKKYNKLEHSLSNKWKFLILLVCFLKLLIFSNRIFCKIGFVKAIYMYGSCIHIIYIIHPNIPVEFGCFRILSGNNRIFWRNMYVQFSLISSVDSKMPRCFVSPISIIQWFSTLLRQCLIN